MDRFVQSKWFLIFLLFASVVYGAAGDIGPVPDGAKVIWNNNSQTFSIAASSSMSESVDYTWPLADGAAGQALITDGSGVLSFTAPSTSFAHDFLSVTHTDTLASTVTAGDIIFGNATPKWDDLAIGTANDVLRVSGGFPDWQATTFITELGTIATGTWQATDVGVAHGGTGSSNASDARTALGLAIGTNVQAWDLVLDDLSALSAVTNNQFIVGTGAGVYAHESGSDARDSIGLGALDSVVFEDEVLSSLSPDLLISTDENKFLVSVGDLTAWIAGTANQVIVTDDTDGTVTLSTPQDIDTTATLTLEDVTITGLTGSIISSESVETSIEELDASLYATNGPTGLPNRDDSALSWEDAVARTMRITPTGASFDIWQKGTKYTISSDDDFQISTVSGFHAVYYDAGSLAESVNPSEDDFDVLILDKVLVALVYWNNTDGAAYILADERHGTDMSGRTHEALHDGFGALLSIGAQFTISGYTEDTDSDAGLTFELENGEFYDDDLDFTVVDGSAANQYEQQLSAGDAEIPILYREGDPGHWTEDAATTLPYKTSGVGGEDRLSYNSLTGSTWGQTEIADGRWVSMTLVITNDWQYPIKAIQGQTEYVDNKTAVEDASNEILAFGDLPTPEMIILYRFVLKTKDAYGGTKNAKIEVGGVTDFRGAGISGTGALLGDHGALGGLSDDDHAQYLLANGARALAGAWDMGNQALTNVNVDSGAIDGTIIGANSDAVGTFTTLTVPNASADTIETYIYDNEILGTRYINGIQTGMRLRGRHARGTPGSEDYLNTDDIMMLIDGQGWNGTGFSESSGAIRLEADENHESGKLGGKWRFYTIAPGSTTQAVRWNMRAGGHWIPQLDDTYNIGTPLHRVQELFVTTVTEGDHVFAERDCILCEQQYAEGDAIVNYVLHNTWEGTRCVPVHLECYMSVSTEDKQATRDAVIPKIEALGRYIEPKKAEAIDPNE